MKPARCIRLVMPTMMVTTTTTYTQRLIKWHATTPVNFVRCATTMIILVPYADVSSTVSIYISVNMRCHVMLGKKYVIHMRNHVTMAESYRIFLGIFLIDGPPTFRLVQEKVEPMKIANF